MAFEAGSAFVKEHDTTGGDELVTVELNRGLETFLEIIPNGSTFKVYAMGPRDAADPTAATKSGMTQIGLPNGSGGETLDAQSAAFSRPIEKGPKWLTVEFIGGSGGDKVVTTQQ